jgi:hypothetical protein
MTETENKKIITQDKNGTFHVPDMPRAKHKDPFNYTEAQLLQKKIDMKLIKELYPDVNDYYAEMVYDMLKNTTEEEQEEMKQKILNEPTRHVIPEVLLSHDCEILTPEEAEEKPLGDKENNNVLNLLESN